MKWKSNLSRTRANWSRDCLSTVSYSYSLILSAMFSNDSNWQHLDHSRQLSFTSNNIKLRSRRKKKCHVKLNEWNHRCSCRVDTLKHFDFNNWLDLKRIPFQLNFLLWTFLLWFYVGAWCGSSNQIHVILWLILVGRRKHWI